MIIFFIILLATALIGFMWGGFLALVIFVLTMMVGYLGGIFIALVFILLLVIVSAVYKFGIINFIKNKRGK